MKKENALGQTDGSLDEKLVFLVGPPRSGTTWLQGILANHPSIGTAQESHMFNHFLQPMMAKWDELLDFDDGRGGIGMPAYLTEQQFISMIRDTATAVYSSVPEYEDNKLFLDKTPDHIRCIADIRKVFPDARIIVLLRKPEDVIESLMNAAKSWGKNWAPNSIFSAVRTFQWFFSVPGTEELLLRDPNLCLIRYEELKSSPAKTLNTVLHYLDEPVDDETLQKMLSMRHTLHKYGESALRSGVAVEEPENFARKKKGSLSWIQKKIISLALAKHSKTYGYAEHAVANQEPELVRSQS